MAVVGVQAAIRARAADRRTEQRADTVAYFTALEPLAEDAGRIVELGLKDTLNELDAMPQADPLLARSARSFHRQLGNVRAEIAALDAPEGADVSGFTRAVDGYMGVAAALERAANEDAAARGPFIDQVTNGGRAADELWDTAAADLQAHAREVGVQPVAWLPAGLD